MMIWAWRLRSITAATIFAAALPVTALHADQTELGPWNGEAAKIAENSALARSAMAFIGGEIAKIQNPAIRRATQDAVLNPNTCIKSRISITEATKKQIVDKLIAEGLIDQGEAGLIPGGLIAGVFPAVRDEGTACPKLPMPYIAAPGSVFGGHHSQPGGLAMHASVNLATALNLADTYRHLFGTLDANGRPAKAGHGGNDADKDVVIDQDIVIAAPIWHDWAKTAILQWNADGSEFKELNYGGNGKTDAWGAPGNTKTASHHMMGIAEAMARGMPADLVITHASSHAAPTETNEFSVVNWIRAAAILANVDPVERGYLMKDSAGRLRLAALRKLGSINIQESLPKQPNMLYEYALHNLSDADFTFARTASAQSDLFLRLLAPKFGYDPAQTMRFNTAFRNPLLANTGAERLLMLYANGGIDRVEAEITKLKKAGVIE
jgi:hypothetical protein